MILLCFSATSAPLRIPALAKNYGYVEVNGYLEPSGGTSDTAIVNDVGRFLTYISPFSYQINEDGSLTAPPDGPVLAAVGRFRVAPLMVVTNFLMGMPLYGYDWKLPYVKGGEWAKRVSPQQALVLAARYGANIQYDAVAQSPFFNYTDETGIQHVVWFEDARSVQAKYLLVNKYGLRGVSYWVLGLPFPQNWAVLDNMFNIVKVAG